MEPVAPREVDHWMDSKVYLSPGLIMAPHISDGLFPLSSGIADIPEMMRPAAAPAPCALLSYGKRKSPPAFASAALTASRFTLQFPGQKRRNPWAKFPPSFDKRKSPSRSCFLGECPQLLHRLGKGLTLQFNLPGLFLHNRGHLPGVRLRGWD